MKLVALIFKAEGRYYIEEQGKDYPVEVEVRALLHSDGQTLIITDVTPIEEPE
jgi:hypothetical protein